MQQYLDLLKKIVDTGVEKESGRDNMPNTIGISHAVIQMNLADKFPLLTTKKLHFRGIVNELLWFLRGDTNIKWLVDNGTNIWNDDAYRWYQKHRLLGIERIKNSSLSQDDIDHFVALDYDEEYSQEKFIDLIKANELGDSIAIWSGDYRLGDLGKIYGYQWRNQNGVDQVKDVIDGLKKNPYSRYHIIGGWNKSDFPEMALPPCHLLYQFIVRPLTTEQRREEWDKKRDGLPNFALLGRNKWKDRRPSIR